MADSCISACAASLERLDLSLPENTDYMLGAWTSTVCHLQRLRVSSDSMSAMDILVRLTSLQRLDLPAYDWQPGTSVWLPPSLTMLSITKHNAIEMPSKVRWDRRS